MNTAPDRHCAQNNPAEPERRTFLKQIAAAAAGIVALLVPLGAGLAAFLDPLRKRSAGGKAVLITSLQALPEDGRPRRFPVIAQRVDAWNKSPAAPIGAVYLRRTGPTTVHAYNATCPHTGCLVKFEGNGFACPCHNSTFNLDGSIRNPDSPSPRSLDELEVKIREGTQVWVTFQNFRAGTARKVPLA